MIGIKDFKMPKGCGDCACYDEEWQICALVNKSAEDYNKRLEECPLVEDVAPVRHAKWKDDGEMMVCSNCGFGCHLEKSPNRFEMLKELTQECTSYSTPALTMG